MYRLVFAAALALTLAQGAPAPAQEKPVKILLIAKDRDHAFS
jgi:hypothetical protein